MPNYRRNYVPGGTYFFTVVTHQRRPFLTNDLARLCLSKAIRKELDKRPFDLFAIVFCRIISIPFGLCLLATQITPCIWSELNLILRDGI